MDAFRRHSLRLLFALAAACSLPAAAQTFPSQPITIILPYSPGGAVDAMARLLATKLGERLRVPVVVKNVAGASGAIGMAEVARAAGDGYTLLYAPSTIAILPAFYHKLSFDPAKDLVPVSQFLEGTLLVAANPGTGIGSLQELISRAKAKPGKLNFGSSGVADTLQLGIEMLKVDTGTDMVAVPYKGQGPMLVALLAGEVDVAVVSVQLSLPYIRNGKLRALAVTSPKRSPALPDVPTVSETVPGYELASWHGVFAPASTPRDLVQRLQREIEEISKDPAVRKTVEDAGNAVLGSTSEAFRKKFEAEIVKYKNVVKQAQLPLQD